MAYDAWGKRRFPNGTPDTADTLVGLTTDRGYTGHEELDELGIIHMNGRIYDPLIARFMSADPYIQAPYELQSHNRYAYVMNNPLLYTDPSGYSWWTKIRGVVVTVIAAIADANGCGGYCSQALQYYNTAKTVYNFAQTVQSQGMGAALKGAAISYAIDLVARRAFGASGDVGGTGSDQYGLGHYAATAVAGCVSTVAGGGKCGQGAIAAIAGLYTSQVIDGQGYAQTDLNKAYHHAAVQITGGLTSQAVGGSFANGAQTASYGYLYNHERHDRDAREYAERKEFERRVNEQALVPLCVLECVAGAGLVIRAAMGVQVGMDLSVLTTKELTSLYSISQKELLSIYFKGGSGEGLLPLTVAAYREIATRSISFYETAGKALGLATQRARLELLDRLKQ